jgi:RHS repeat-associated protein
VIATVDSNGTLQQTRKYDAYGAVRTSTGGSGTRHKFCGNLGHPSDDETGLVYMRARFYDPLTGRFVSEDPKYTGGNWYEYANDSPTNASDASGAAPDWINGGAFLLGLFLTTCSALVAWTGANDAAGYCPLPIAFTARCYTQAMLLAIAAVAVFSVAMGGLEGDRVQGALIAALDGMIGTLGLMMGGVTAGGSVDLPGVRIAILAAFTHGLIAASVLVGSEIEASVD